MKYGKAIQQILLCTDLWIGYCLTLSGWWSFAIQGWWNW